MASTLSPVCSETIPICIPFGICFQHTLWSQLQSQVHNEKALKFPIMNRRTFVQLAALPALAAQTPAATTTAGRMKLGTQHGSSDDILRVLAALGVSHICTTLPSEKLDESWSVEGLAKLRERVNSFGIALEAVPLPLSSHYIAKSENPNIMLGKSPERDREIDNICQMIRYCAKDAIPTEKYN